MSKTVHPEFRPLLLEAREEAPGVRTFRFASWPGFAFIPGQFLMFHFSEDPKTWRAYSICSSPLAESEYFEVTVGLVGAFSERLGALAPGLEGGLVVRGPFGKWTWSGDGHAVLISGGSGITPFRAMALLGKGKTTIFYSAKTTDDLLYKNEYDVWKKSGVVIHARTTRQNDSRWTPAEIVTVSNDPSAVFYICGPKSLVEEMKTGLAAAGVTPERIRTEKWGDYAELF